MGCPLLLRLSDIGAPCVASPWVGKAEKRCFGSSRVELFAANHLLADAASIAKRGCLLGRLLGVAGLLGIFLQQSLQLLIEQPVYQFRRMANRLSVLVQNLNRVRVL